MRDRQTGRTTVVHHGEDDCTSDVMGLSANGRFVTFYAECSGDQLYISDGAR